MTLAAVRRVLGEASHSLMIAVLVAGCGTHVDRLDRFNGDGFGGDGSTPGDGDISFESPELTHSAGGTSWTVLVYMVADNDLEPFALLDLQEMTQVGGAAGFTIVAQVDRAPGYTADPVGLVPNWTDTRRLRVEAGRLVELEDIGEKDMGDPMVLADFVTWGISNYPADNIAVIFWDHGSAWPGFGADMTSQYDGLTLAELSLGMSAGLAGAHRDRVALVGFDACLMGSLETALVMRDFAEYMLASEELEPGHGWDYAAFNVARAKPTTNPIDLAKAIMTGFRAQAISQDTSATITLSLLDLYNLKAIERAIDDMSRIFLDDDSLVTRFGRARADGLEFGRQASPEDSALMVDLGDVAGLIAAGGGPVANAANAVVSAVRAAVLNATSGSATAAATGISVYWPPYRTLYDVHYDNVPAITVWRTLLSAIQDASSGGTSMPKFVSPTAAMSPAGGYLTLSGNLVAGTQLNVVAEGMYYGLHVDDRYFVLGDTYGALDGVVVSATWDKTAMVVTQGSKSDYTYFSYQPGENGTFVATLPFGYATSASSSTLDTALLVLVYDATGALTQQTFFLSTAAGYGELTPAPGSVLYPVYAELTDQGMFWGATPTVFDANAGFSLSLDVLSTSASNRSAFGVIYADDIAGNTAEARWEGEL